MRRVFIIGPAGVGKSTCGELFAKLLNYAFVDQDAEFNKRIGEIESYIRRTSYRDYCFKNSALFYELIDEQKSDTVYALSSGFLLYRDVDEGFSGLADALGALGVSILLLPSRSLEETEEIVVTRVLARRITASGEKEKLKIRDRYPKYLRHGDIKIFSVESPGVIARRMREEYAAVLEQRVARG